MDDVEALRRMPNPPTHVMWLGPDPMRWRRLARLRAWLTRDRWYDCPTCGGGFALREWREPGWVPHPDAPHTRGILALSRICPACTAYGRGHRGWDAWYAKPLETFGVDEYGSQHWTWGTPGSGSWGSLSYEPDNPEPPRG